MGFWQSHHRGVLPTWVLAAFLITYGLAFVGLYAQEGFSTNTIGALGVGVIWVSLVFFNKVTWCYWLSIFGAVVGSLGGLALISAVGFNSPAGLLGLVYIGYSIFWPLFFRQYLPLKNDNPDSLVSLALAPTVDSPLSSEDIVEEKRTDSVEKPESYSEDDYATELDLFEKGDLSKPLWSKHLVEAEGDTEKAKWRYIKERVAGAPERRALQAKLALEERQKAEDEAKEAERHAERVAKENQKRLEEEQYKRERALKREEFLQRRREQDAAVEEALRGAQYESPNILSDLIKPGLGYVTLFIVAIVLALVFLGFILDDAPSERIADQEQALESRAYDLLQRSQEQFYGVTGSVDEKAAETSASLALSRLENIDSDYANYLRDSIRLWLVNVLSCASSPLVRDLDGAEEVKRQISDLSADNVKANFFWDVYWGEDLPQGALDKSAYLEWKNEANRIIAEWGLNGQSNAVLISALEREAVTDTTSAFVLAQFYECRAQNQEFELASDWYVRALENAKRTQGSSDPVDEDTVEMIRSRLERLRKVISATYLQ